MFLCKRYSAKRTDVKYAPIPLDRIRVSRPFEVVGVDFAGPLYVKQREPKSGTAKAFVLLFTCASTRAVHLELRSGLSSAVFLLAFRRFLSRRGIPLTIYSDNALAFKRASRGLQDIWSVMNGSPFSTFLACYRIEWNFNVPSAPRWGGWWERLIRSVKTALRRTLGKQMLDSEQLTTLLTKVEVVINSRPLNYMYTDAREPAPNCPANFLVGKSVFAEPVESGEEYQSRILQTSQENLIKKLRHRNKLLKHLWLRWKKEYLLELRSLHHYPTARDKGLKVDDIVIVEEPNASRCVWTLGRITEVYPGRDGLVRACRVQTQGGKITRPVQRLYPLEIPSVSAGRENVEKEVV